MNRNRESQRHDGNLDTVRTITDDLFARLYQRGFRATIVSATHLQALREDIEGKRQAELLDSEFYRIELAGFAFEVPADLPGAQSVIIVAAPQPHTLWTFKWNGRAIPAVIPATYSHQVNDQVRAILDESLPSAGYSSRRAWIPLKLTAAHSGLARYGKNNIVYVDGMGSQVRLMAFFTDLPCPQDTWGEPRVLDECDKCSVCKVKCPTGAITADRFLIHAERCLTFINEHEGEFPAWVDPSAHHCLVGCLMCQAYCPVNRPISPLIEVDAAFTDEETGFFLKGASKDELPPETTRKFDRFPQLLDTLKEMSRNLRVLVARPEKAEKTLRYISDAKKQ